MSDLLAMPHNSGQKPALPQHQSLLYNLPFEIRCLIWTIVVGSQIVHITELKNKIGHVTCMDPSASKWGLWQHDCWCRSLTKSGFHISPRSYASKKHIVGSLGLLRSCRKIYSEAISVLYERRAFNLRSMDTMNKFLASVPQQLQHITSLHLEPSVHMDIREWNDTWRFLSTFKSLKILMLELRGNIANPYSKARLLQDLCCIEHTEKFEVKVKWDLDDVRDLLWAMPYDLEDMYGGVIVNGEREYLEMLKREMVDLKKWRHP